MTTASDLVREMAEQEELDAIGVLQALNSFFERNDLAIDALEALNDWMDDERLQDELANWMAERGVTIAEDSLGDDEKVDALDESEQDDFD